MSRLDSAAVMETPVIDGPEGLDVAAEQVERPFPMQMHPRHRLGGWRLLTPEEVEKHRASGTLVESAEGSCLRGECCPSGPVAPAVASV
jgi:hypothetical protein